MKQTYITNLSSERDGSIRLTATGVPRHWAFKISPNDPCSGPVLTKGKHIIRLLACNIKNAILRCLCKTKNGSR